MLAHVPQPDWKRFLKVWIKPWLKTPPLLVAPDEAKEAFAKLVNAISNGGSESIVSDITLRITGNGAADQSPDQITLVSSAEGQMLRSALQAVEQPGSSGQNSRDQPAKCWEFRPYRPRKGALVRELQSWADRWKEVRSSAASPSRPGAAC